MKLQKVSATSPGRLATVAEVRANLQWVDQTLQECVPWTIALLDGGKFQGKEYGNFIEEGDFTKQVEDKTIGEKIIVIEGEGNETMEVKSTSQASTGKTCSHEHVLKVNDCSKNMRRIGCNQCQKKASRIGSFGCRICDYDECKDCYATMPQIAIVAEIDWLDENGNTALFRAVKEKDVEATRKAVEAGADVNKDQGLMGGTVLMAAACENMVDICKILVKAGADVNKSLFGMLEIDGLTPLMFAATEGHIKICKILIEAGANINKKNKDGYGKTALDIAKEKEHFEIVELLEKHGATVSEIKGLEDILEFHEITVTEIDKEDERENSPLMYAAILGNKTACRLLIEAGADVNKVNNDDYEKTALIMAAQRGHTEICELLISAGADIEKVDINGENALMHATGNGYDETSMILISAGADINKQDNSGDTALYNAATFGHTEICKLLISKGAQVDTAEIRLGCTPLMKAAERGYVEICKLLIEAGAQLDIENKDGWTALFYGGRDEHNVICKMLIEAGADISKASKDETGWEREIAVYLAGLA